MSRKCKEDARVAIENLLVFGICAYEVDEQGNAEAIDMNDYITLT